MAEASVTGMRGIFDHRERWLCMPAWLLFARCEVKH